ncbi:metalloendopeptidase [Methylopila jiangsuensis]|uniref:Metalloendopeptidase n=1 Tax=Methylopila jiangsuensis TaxID=586230 RepID=A0A9W6N5A7_9HYPH|nr:M48 family metallopeptidase [Methylopila jiangsuensis]MDR6284451.1 Zn-dependent protease with chaperone function [Methylopila jiangsuensis]GLK78163.1 metalloendopeptidase [Methylopila jiangsuensis]
MTTSSGTGVFFDGLTSRRQDVHVSLAEEDLAVLAPDGRMLARWPLGQLREAFTTSGRLRLTRDAEGPPARLELADGPLADAIRAAAPALHAARASERTATRRVVLWSVAAVVSLTALGLFGLPALADKVAPLLPWSVDRRMGEVVDAQLRYLLPTGQGGFACGETATEAPGRAALDRLAAPLERAAGLPVPLKITVVRSAIPNALALPGGPIYLFDGLIREARSPDELAGVLAHEIGHVAHRDGARRTLQAGGLSFLFGFVLGDFAGGGAAVFVARMLSEASYSRQAESAADGYAVALMRRAGGDPAAFGALLARLTGEQDDDGAEAERKRSPLDYVASHPDTLERKRVIEAAAGPRSGDAAPLLTPAEFAALKAVCGANPSKDDDA